MYNRVFCLLLQSVIEIQTTYSAVIGPIFIIFCRRRLYRFIEFELMDVHCIFIILCIHRSESLRVSAGHADRQFPRFCFSPRKRLEQYPINVMFNLNFILHESDELLYSILRAWKIIGSNTRRDTDPPTRNVVMLSWRIINLKVFGFFGLAWVQSSCHGDNINRAAQRRINIFFQILLLSSCT